MFRFQKTFSIFTPGEAERITGVSVTLQRDWRRRGILPKNEGFARFELPALLEMHTLKLLSDAGLGIEGAREWIPFVPARIAYEALTVEGAIEGDMDTFPAGYLPSVPLDVARTISRVLPDPESDLVIWADGSSAFVREIPDAIRDAPLVKSAGVVRILNFEAIGSELARRAGRALVHVERVEIE